MAFEIPCQAFLNYLFIYSKNYGMIHTKSKRLFELLQAIEYNMQGLERVDTMKKKKTSQLGEVLSRLMFERKLRATDLARELGLPQPTIHRMATGKSPNPHRASLEPIAQYFDITVDQLKGDTPLPETVWGDSLLPTKPADTRHVPIVKWADLPEVKFPAPVQDDQFVVTAPDLGERCFATYMNDSSMEPHFSVGTTLIVDPDKPPKDRSFVLIKLHETGVPIFRQLLIDADFQYLKPLNPDLSAFQMRLLEEDDKILGTLVEARRNYNEV